jgi:hypothetical protein
MSVPQQIRAPLQLEKLTDEELLQCYCETREELHLLALWERIAGSNKKGIYKDLKRRAHNVCPPGYDRQWMFWGSYTRAFFRFKRNIHRFAGRLNTPHCAAYTKRLVEHSVLDEYRFVTGEGQAIWVRIGDFDIVDDTGNLIRTDHEQDADLWRELDRARQEDERHLAGEAGHEERSPGDGVSIDGARTADEHTEEHAEPRVAEGAEPQPFRARRAARLYSAHAQPIPRPDAVVSAKERKQIVKILILDHIGSAAGADSMDVIIRFFYRQLAIARIAVWQFGEPATKTVRNRHEKRVRDMLHHDLKSMHKALNAKFKITAFGQV